jgi:O-antigen/teichoic acid export membrane protein
VLKSPLAATFKQALDTGLAGQLARGGAGSLAIKAATTLLGFVLAILLARILGPEGYGIYAYVFALVSVLAIPAQFGLPNLIVRETAKANVNKHWGLMLGVWRWATVMTGVFSAILVFIAAGMAWLFVDRFSDRQLETFLWGLTLVPLIALANLRGAALRGLHKVVLGQIPERVLRPHR